MPNISLWYETFGEKKNPPLLLIAGGLCQGILWPDEFCEALAKKGLYVIRYDHRDSGLSTCVDFTKAPYSLYDMAEDATQLLDYLKIEKAHACGISMGGVIAELMSAHFPERISTIALFSTSCDLRPLSVRYHMVESILQRVLCLDQKKSIHNGCRDFYNTLPHTLKSIYKSV